MLTFGVVTDVHIGPNASFDGKLRKLSHHAESLLAQTVARLCSEHDPDFIVNLGDLIEDVEPEVDRQRYARGVELLEEGGCPVVHVAGNHDRARIEDAQLRQMWGMPPSGHLYRSFDAAGVHLVVLATHETKDVDVTIDEQQLEWLREDLAQTSLPSIVLMHHSAADQDVRANRWFCKAPHLCLVKQRKHLRAVLAESGRVSLVLNGHLHWNHLQVINGIPYLTLQSLVENLDEDAPGRPAAAFAVVRAHGAHVHVEVGGVHPSRYQFDLCRLR